MLKLPSPNVAAKTHTVYLSYKGAYGPAVLPGNLLFKLTLAGCKRNQAVRKSCGPHVAHSYRIKLQLLEYTERRTPGSNNNNNNNNNNNKSKNACVCPMFYPSLRGLPEVWHHSWIYLRVIEVSSVKGLSLRSNTLRLYRAKHLASMIWWHRILQWLN